MNPAIFWSKPALAAYAIVGSFWAGMTIESWRRDSGELAEVKDAKSRYVGAVERSEKVALTLQTELDRLASTKPVIIKELTRETQRIEYRCSLPTSGRLLYVRAAEGDGTVAGDLPQPVPPPGESARAGGPR